MHSPTKSTGVFNTFKFALNVGISSSSALSLKTANMSPHPEPTALDQVTKNMPKTPEYSMRKTQQSAVAKKLTEVARYYNDVQTKYKQKYRERMERQYRIGVLSTSNRNISPRLQIC